jgi:hypothetical protein
MDDDKTEDSGEKKTIVLIDRWAVNRRLKELNLSRKGLMNAVTVALHEGRTATAYHCANTAGTFSYHHGTWAIRHEFVGDRWAVNRERGVEAIYDKVSKLRVIFQNVDVACDSERLPQPRTPKGSGSELVSSGNLFGDLPHYTPRQSKTESTFYLMVDTNGACELSMPVVKKGKFISLIERLYLNDGFNLEDDGRPQDEEETVEKFDPQVTRK